HSPGLGPGPPAASRRPQPPLPRARRRARTRHAESTASRDACRRGARGGARGERPLPRLRDPPAARRVRRNGPARGVADPGELTAGEAPAAETRPTVAPVTPTRGATRRAAAASAGVVVFLERAHGERSAAQELDAFGGRGRGGQRREVRDAALERGAPQGERVAIRLGTDRRVDDE